MRYLIILIILSSCCKKATITKTEIIKYSTPEIKTNFNITIPKDLPEFERKLDEYVKSDDVTKKKLVKDLSNGAFKDTIITKENLFVKVISTWGKGKLELNIIEKPQDVIVEKTTKTVTKTPSFYSYKEFWIMLIIIIIQLILLLKSLF